MEIKTLQNISDVDKAKWNELVGEAYPFISWEFLYALEASGDVASAKGWQPQHICVWQQGELIAVMPQYLKQHSHGEYVFDYVWANAYHRHGLNYYPKWLSAIPFTPCQGPRLLVSENHDSDEVFTNILLFIASMSEKHDISSWHCLFPERQDFEGFKNEKLLVREAVQFQWFNKSYRTFDDFIGTFKSKYRKNLKRERRRIAEQNIKIKRLQGSDISLEVWQVFFDYYRATYFKRGMEPYLSFEFFQMIAESMGEKLLMVVAEKDERIVACALSVVGQDTLYGRYWGCFEEFNNLHFELCYYQGLEFCIENNLTCFNSGAQGEHKISRGFEPVITYSLHWFRHEGFADAIRKFLADEKQGIEGYRKDAELMLPFSQNVENGKKLGD